MGGLYCGPLVPALIQAASATGLALVRVMDLATATGLALVRGLGLGPATGLALVRVSVLAWVWVSALAWVWVSALASVRVSVMATVTELGANPREMAKAVAFRDGPIRSGTATA